MPPKARGRIAASSPSSSRLLTASANPPCRRDNFSLASFFDAAGAGRSVGGGGGRGEGERAPYGDVSFASAQRPFSLSTATGRSEPSGTDRFAATQLPPAQHHERHWSSANALTSSYRVGEEVEALPQPSPPHVAIAPSGDVSATLQEVRHRIISELASSSDGSRGAAEKLHAHRQRALWIAFGRDDAASSVRGSRSSRAEIGDEGNAAGDSACQASQRRSHPAGEAEDDGDGELMVASVEFSLLCPYSRLPMLYPTRSRECNHLQCCDVDSWMVMLDKGRSLRDPVGPCPVCERRVAASSLEVDLWVKNVVDQMPAGTHMVVLERDGAFHSGDSTREKRKEQLTMEVVDATQGDYENYLGEVVDDDDDDVVQTQGGARMDSRTRLIATVSTAGARRERSSSPVVPYMEGADRLLGVGSDAPPHSLVKTEKAAAAESAVVSPFVSPKDLSSQDDGGVVIVHFVEGKHDGLQALPSQIRLWIPHCTRCGAPRVKAEDGSIERCQRCGQDEKDTWNLVRRFEASPAVSMELMPDGTLLLHGVDLMAPYLYRAGFHRSLFEAMEYASVAEQQQTHYRAPIGVWSSSFPLSRFEIDFLEACCTRIAQGEAQDSIEALIVPSLFRIPYRRRTSETGSRGVAWSSHTTA